MIKYIRHFFVTTGLFATGYQTLNYYRHNHLYRGQARLEQEPQALDQTPTVVRIWDSNVKDQIVGHASLQIGQDYLSFWPKSAVNIKSSEGKTVGVKAKIHTMEEDLEAEGKLPDRIFELNYLNKEKMIEEIHRLQGDVAQDKVGYCLSGRAVKGDTSCLNCTTAVFQVLQRGGLEKIPVVDDMLTSPKALGDIIAIAAKNEHSANNSSLRL